MHARTIALFVFLLLACGASSARSVDAQPVPVPHAEQLFDAGYRCAATAALEHLKDVHQRFKLPSISAAVSVDGELVWAGVVGWADLERQLPATIDTRYRIGSTSKLVTATLLARLHDQGRMGLDDRLGDYAANLPNRHWKALTARQLASHTAGIVGYANNRDLPGLLSSLRERRQFDSVAEALALFDGNRLMFRPGEGFHYSSFGTVLLSYAIEQAAGGRFLDLLRDEVTVPAGTNGPVADTPEARAGGQGAVHYKRTRRGGLVPWRAVNHSYKWAGGGLVATSSDLAILGGRWFDPAFIQPETAGLFWQPQRLADGSDNPQSYAIGSRSHRSGALLGQPWAVHSVNHGGVSKGANSWLNLYPELGVAIALNTNVRFGEFSDFIQVEYPITRVFVASIPGVENRLPEGAVEDSGRLQQCRGSEPQS